MTFAPRPSRVSWLLVALLLGTAFGATGSPEGFSLPAFRVGDVVDFEGPIGFRTSGRLTVEPPTKILGASAAEVSVLPFRMETDSENATFYLGLATGRLEAAEFERVGDNWSSFAWYYHGGPGVFGASLLQSRNFEIGDSWEFEGDCLVCERPIAVEILPPDATSPEGTDFVARVSVETPANLAAHSHFRRWGPANTTLHMDENTPYPLRADVPRGSVNLTSYVPGDLPVPLATEAIILFPILQASPFQLGFPAEGEPEPGYPSYAEARLLTGYALPPPGERFLWAAYALDEGGLWTWTFGDLWPSPVGGQVVNLSKSITISHSFGANDIATTRGIHGERFAPDYAPDVGHRVWTHSPLVFTQRWPMQTNCDDANVPPWDAVRFVRGLRVFDQITAWSVLTNGCADLVVGVSGSATKTEGFFTIREALTLDGQTGHLRSYTGPRSFERPAPEGQTLT